MAENPQLTQIQQAVDQRLDQILPPEETIPTELHQAMRYSALAPGKRLRPALLIASTQALGGTTDQALDAACSTELIHCFSLIHDDLPAIDDDDLRRGRPTCHVKFGEPLAILAGDALFALAFQTAAHCSSDPTVIAKTVQILADAASSKGLVGGEVMDIQAEGQPGDLQLLQTIHQRKTGALIAASCQIGAILANATPEQLQQITTYGNSVGLAFQIADDILNETSTPEQLGKATGSDREKNKLTYPALLGLKESQDAADHAKETALQALQYLPGDTTLLHSLANYSITRQT